MLDFMTLGGGAHPVWWDERVQYTVLFGGNIDGEVRVLASRGLISVQGDSAFDRRSLEGLVATSSGMSRLLEAARRYPREMNLCEWVGGVAREGWHIADRPHCRRYGQLSGVLL